MTFKVTVVNKFSENVLHKEAITSSDIRFFIEKLKAVISKKIFEESAALPFSQNKAEKYAQIRFLTNACVDTMWIISRAISTSLLTRSAVLL